MKKQFLKAAGVKTDKEFYKKYPTQESFFEAHPEMRHLLGVSNMNVPNSGIRLEDYVNSFNPNPPNVGTNKDTYPGSLQSFMRENAPLGTRINPDYRAADTFPYSGTLKDAIDGTNPNPPNIYEGKTPGFSTTIKKAPNGVLPFGDSDLDAKPIPAVPEYAGQAAPPDLSHLSFGEAFKLARKEFGPGSTFMWKGKLKGTQLKGEAPAMDPGMAYHAAAITGQMPINKMESAMGASRKTGVSAPDLSWISDSVGSIPAQRMIDQHQFGIGEEDLQQRQYGGNPGPTAAEFYNPGVWPIGPAAFYQDGGRVKTPDSDSELLYSRRWDGMERLIPGEYGIDEYKTAGKFYDSNPWPYIYTFDGSNQVQDNVDLKNFNKYKYRAQKTGMKAKDAKKQVGGTITKGVPYSTDEVTGSRFNNTMGYIRDNNMNSMSSEMEEYFKCGGPKKQFGGEDNPYGYKGTAKYNTAADNAFDQANTQGGWNFPSYMNEAVGSMNPYWNWKGDVNGEKFDYDMPMAQFGKNLKSMFQGTPAVDPSTMPGNSANIQQYKYKAGFNGPRKVKLRGQFNFGDGPMQFGDTTDPSQSGNAAEAFYVGKPMGNELAWLTNNAGQFGSQQDLGMGNNPMDNDPMTKMDQFRGMRDFERNRKQGERQDFRATKGMNSLYNRGFMFDERMKDRYFDEDMREYNRAQDYPNMVDQNEVDRIMRGQRKQTRRSQRRAPNADELYNNFKMGGEYEMTEKELARFLKAGGQVEYL